MEPVDPRMAMRFIKTASYFTRFWAASEGREAGRSLHHAPSCIVPQHWSGKEQGIDAIKHAAVARKNRTGVFHVGAALDERFDQVAELGCNVKDDREQDDRQHGGLFEPEEAVTALDESGAKHGRTQRQGIL